MDTCEGDSDFKLGCYGPQWLIKQLPDDRIEKIAPAERKRKV